MFGLFKDSKREQLEKEVILATLRTHLTIANCAGTDQPIEKKIVDFMACQKFVEMMKKDREAYLQVMEENKLSDCEMLDTLSEINSHMRIGQLLEMIQTEGNNSFEMNQLKLEYIPESWEDGNYKPDHIRYSKDLDFDSILDELLNK